MAQAGTKSPKIEADRYRLGEPGRTELQDFCEAMFGTDQSKIIRAAVAAFIRAELDRNEGVRERYETLRRARRERNGNVYWYRVELNKLNELIPEIHYG